MATAPNIPQKPLAPDQMKAYRLIVKQAMQFLLTQEHAALIVKKAESGDPKQAVVDAISPLMQQIFSSATQAGAKVETPTVLAASIEVIGNLADMLSSVGIITKQQIPQFAADVAKVGVQQHNSRATQLQQKAGATPAAAPGMPPAPGPQGGA